MGLWTLRLPCPKPLKDEVLEKYKYQPDPGLFAPVTVPSEDEENDDDDGGVEEVPPPPPLPPSTSTKKRKATSVKAEESRKKGKAPVGKKQKGSGSGSPAPESSGSVVGSEHSTEVQLPIAVMSSLLQEILHLLKDGSPADKRHALCHTNMMAAMSKQFQHLERVYGESLATLEGDLIASLTEAVAEKMKGSLSTTTTATPTDTTALVNAVTSVVVEKLQAAQTSFHQKINYNSTVMLDDIRQQTQSVHGAVAHSTQDIAQAVGDRIDAVANDVAEIREEMQSMRELVSASLVTRAQVVPPTFRRHPAGAMSSSFATPAPPLTSSSTVLPGSATWSQTMPPTLLPTGASTTANLFGGGGPSSSSSAPAVPPDPGVSTRGGAKKVNKKGGGEKQ